MIKKRYTTYLNVLETVMNQHTLSSQHATTMETNKLIKNTYMLLSMTLIFSGVMAFVSILMQASFGIAFASTLIGIGLLAIAFWDSMRQRQRA